MELKSLTADNNFWVDVKFVVEFVEPICDMLHYANIVGPCLGDIYENMDSTCERIKSITNPKRSYFMVTIEIIYKWEVE